jgi:hydrogenase expression/formation protein HypD
VLDAARAIALLPQVILSSFGDMLRVPGNEGDLLDARAHGADVRVVVSPIDAVRLAASSRDREVVLFGVGFETTAPAIAMAVLLAERMGLENFSVLASHVRVPPAIAHLLSQPGNRVQAFLAAGHVCTVAGTADYPPLAARFGVPIVVTGFEPLDILRGLALGVRQLEAGRAEVENQYDRSVQRDGNVRAREAVARVFAVADTRWRGIGIIAEGGLRMREAYASFDAERRFGVAATADEAPTRCRAGEVLQGRLRPPECPEFGRGCTPDRPLGAPMVSSEGACAAHHRYLRRAVSA